MMGYGFGFGGLGMILFLALIVVVVVLVVKGTSGTRWPPSSAKDSQHQSALQILEERYARGELDREEFLQKKSDFEKKQG
jgi:putative membrane protein